MKKHPFGSTGLMVSPLGFGGASLASAGEGGDGVKAIQMALDAGVNLIDTAACYGDSELVIGRELSVRRNDFILVSKCGHHEILPDGRMRSMRIDMSDVDGALQRLRTDVLDVMLLHSYDRDLLENGEAIAVLAEARKQGKIRFLGYSGDNETSQVAARIPEISVLEMSINLCDQANIRNVLPIARERKLAVISKRSVSNAAWTHRNSAPEAFASLHARTYIERLQRMGLDPLQLGLSSDTDEAWAEMFLRFTISVEGLHCAIVGTTRPEKIQANIAAAEKGPLPSHVVKMIFDVFKRAENDSGEVWIGQN